MNSIKPFTDSYTYIFGSVLILLLLFPAYLYLVFSHRYRRMKEMHCEFNFPSRHSYSKMSVDDAFSIHDYLVHLEFPKVFSSATMFAIFKTYGIPTVSNLLVATGQISSPDTQTGSKRWADTGALLLEAVLNSPTSDRAHRAIARINYLHNIHRSRGRIRDSDLLYTLSLFALEPCRWVARYEWRELTSMELCAIGTFWHSLGKALQVSFGELPSHTKGWKDGLEWLDEIREWSNAYEEKHMLPSPSSHRLAESTFDIVLWKVPSVFQIYVRRTIAVLLGDKLRLAMQLEKPPQTYFHVIRALVITRKFFLQHLALPRRKRVSYLSQPAPSSNRLHMRKYRVHPWYVQPTFMKRWGPAAWRIWLIGGALPGDEGDKYYPRGFLSEELGPITYLDRGGEEMEKTKELLQSSGGGCPFRPL